MDVLTLSLAVQKTLRALGIDGEPEKVLTWDGDTSDAIDTDSGPLVKVHDKFMDMNKVSSISIDSNVLPNFEKKVIPFSDLSVITDEEEKLQVVFPSESIKELNFSIISFMPGTHAEPLEEGVYIAFDVAYHVSEIIFAATTTPIDPKFLPGVCLPVVELSTAFDSTTGEPTVCNESDYQKLEEISDTGTPFVCKLNALFPPAEGSNNKQEGQICGIFSIIKNIAGVAASAFVGASLIMLNQSADAEHGAIWVCTIVNL